MIPWSKGIYNWLLYTRNSIEFSCINPIQGSFFTLTLQLKVITMVGFGVHSLRNSIRLLMNIGSVWVLEYHFVTSSLCQAQFTPGWKSAEWTWRWADLWNNLGFSLYAVLSIYCVVTTSDDGKKSEMGVSADWCIVIEHQRSSLIRDYLHWLSD